jgi:hypothetical protein
VQLLRCWSCHAAATAAKQLLLLLLPAPLLPQLGPSQHGVLVCKSAKLLCQLVLLFHTRPTLVLLLMLLLLLLLLCCIFFYPFIHLIAWLLLPPPLQPLLLLGVSPCCLLDPVLDVAQLTLAR